MRALPLASAKLPVLGTLAFGAQRSPTHVHRGIDLPRQEGTAVFAAADGVVEHASAVWEQGFSGYGGHVVLRHPDGTRTLYAHLSSVAVQPGSLVLAGERIGAVGKTAFTHDDHTALLTSGPHLHFEVSPRAYPQQSEADRLDPVEWLAGAVEPAIAAALAAASRATAVDPLLVRAVAWVASKWNPATPGGLFAIAHPRSAELVPATTEAAATLARQLRRYASLQQALAAFYELGLTVDSTATQWVADVVARYALEQREGASPPLVQRRAADGARS